ncbi:glutathione S-transferase [Saccharibacter sp. 17.LH.SD]|uniref:glutathione S-transferase N-terminal domain-containing protein n=1 Tax=Saccharibacter sp. 17.LH.SD TaxID=2689393 RepID=UPI001370D617|nr:glutathione S-transferase N-terminal domain-containing protein [Saccharibacter sp. 17.LH.SD]MXV43623.1 glutathione S-transferase [Saccharibacter sp. 17.LH.SD]
MAGLLLLGSRRYSSWSLRGWLAVRLAGLDVSEEVIPLKGNGQTVEIHQRSPNRLVPYLEHDRAQIWESLAICAYCAEIEPALWPQDRVSRAHAWSVSAQMHAGFRALRQLCPMDMERQLQPLQGLSSENEEALNNDLSLLGFTLEKALTRQGKVTSFLFGEAPGVADCMYAPIALRIAQYGLEPFLPPEVVAWCQRWRDHALMRLWQELSYKEPAAWRLGYT